MRSRRVICPWSSFQSLHVAPQISALRNQYRVIAPDLRGYGQSPAHSQNAVTQEEFAEDLAHLLDQLEVEKACIVGLSMGGQIAMAFGRRFGQRVSGMVLAATSAEAESAPGVVQRNEMADRILREGMALVGCEMLPKLLGANSLKRSPGLAASVFRMICETPPQSAAAAVRGRAFRTDYREALRHFQFPCLIIVGDQDCYTSLGQAQSMRDAIPCAELKVFQGIGHMPNLEDPEQFNSLLLQFLRWPTR